MNITYVANIRFPTGKAHGIQVAKMCEAIGRVGANLTLVVPSRNVRSSTPNISDPFEFYGIGRTFSVKRIWSPAIASSTRVGFLISTAIFTVMSGLYLLVHRNNDVTYSVDIDHISFLGVLCGKKSRFFEMHAPRASTFLNRLWFGNLAGVIAVNSETADILLREFPALRGHTLTAPNGVDIARYDNVEKQDSRVRLNLPKSARIVLYSGSFQSWKGIDTIMNAAQSTPNVLFYIIGGTEAEFHRTGFAGSVPENVRFAGKRPFTEMPLWHASADVLLVTGTKHDEYSYRHTSPMKLFEYMAARRSIVASRTPAIASVVSEREVFFHEPDDAQDLARALEAALKGSDEKVHTAYEKAKELSWDNRARRVLTFMRRHI